MGASEKLLSKRVAKTKLKLVGMENILLGKELAICSDQMRGFLFVVR